MTYTDTIARVPPGKIGVAEIVHDEPDSFTRLRAAMHGQPLSRQKYCRLLIRNSPVMTDTEFERRSNSILMHKAHGDVLLAGLGIGLVLDPLIERCDSVTVIEKESDVIALVGTHFPKATIIKGDIFDWQPARGRKFDTIYFDIWKDICEDDLAEAKILHGKFRKHLRRGGYMESWCKLALRASR